MLLIREVCSMINADGTPSKAELIILLSVFVGLFLIGLGVGYFLHGFL